MRKKVTIYRLIIFGILSAILFLSCGNPNQKTYTSVPSKASDLDSNKREIVLPGIQPVPKTYTVNFIVPCNDTCRVKIGVYHPSRQLVRALVDSIYSPGNHSFEWDRRGNDKNVLKTGLYYYQFEICGKISTLRLTHQPVVN
jgi:flagellar hook assembly protein FlgD